jgi:hypothetical protein
VSNTDGTILDDAPAPKATIRDWINEFCRDKDGDPLPDGSYALALASWGDVGIKKWCFCRGPAAQVEAVAKLVPGTNFYHLPKASILTYPADSAEVVGEVWDTVYEANAEPEN